MCFFSQLQTSFTNYRTVYPLGVMSKVCRVFSYFLVLWFQFTNAIYLYDAYTHFIQIFPIVSFFGRAPTFRLILQVSQQSRIQLLITISFGVRTAEVKGAEIRINLRTIQSAKFTTLGLGGNLNSYEENRESKECNLKSKK